MRTLGAGAALSLLLGLAAPALTDEKQPKGDPKIEVKKKKDLATYEIPYKFTAANHIVVRLKINGKGPFNFVLDTGAPALYVAVPVAKKARVKADEDGWGDPDRVEVEGGLVLTRPRCRVETPFQLEGMNGLGMAGMEIHGLIGYNVLAKYRMTFDFTTDKLVFTELDYVPEQPFSMRGKAGGGIGGLEMMGQAMKLVGMFLKRKPGGEVTLRGFYGMTLAEGTDGAVVESVLEKGPAGEAGLKKDDVVTRVNGSAVKDVAGVTAAASRSPGKAEVKLTIKRGDKTEEITIKTDEGI